MKPHKHFLRCILPLLLTPIQAAATCLDEGMTPGEEKVAPYHENRQQSSHIAIQYLETLLYDDDAATITYPNNCCADCLSLLQKLPLPLRPDKENQGGCRGIPFNLQRELSDHWQANANLLGAVGTNPKLRSLVIELLGYIPNDEQTSTLQAEQNRRITLQEQRQYEAQRNADLHQQQNQKHAQRQALEADLKSLTTQHDDLKKALQKEPQAHQPQPKAKRQKRKASKLAAKAWYQKVSLWKLIAGALATLTTLTTTYIAMTHLLYTSTTEAATCAPISSPSPTSFQSQSFRSDYILHQGTEQRGNEFHRQRPTTKR